VTEVQRPSEEGPTADDRIAAKQLADHILAAASAYVVILVTPTGRHLRKPYLSLHSAQQALQRAQDRGQPAHLVLCRLEPVGADLDLDGEAT
jgi:hypothetical protein